MRNFEGMQSTLQNLFPNGSEVQSDFTPMAIRFTVHGHKWKILRRGIAKKKTAAKSMMLIFFHGRLNRGPSLLEIGEYHAQPAQPLA